jgi:hypothetical protein
MSGGWHRSNGLSWLDRKRRIKEETAMPRIAIGSNDYTLIVEPATNVNDRPAALRVPERDDANDYAAYWHARSGFFTSSDRSRQRSGEQMRPGADT